MVALRSYCDCASSTAKSPIAFFVDFFNKNKINQAIEIFSENVPDQSDPNCLEGRITSYISPDKLEYHQEYSFEDFNPETLEYSREPVTRKISFRDELYKLLRQEYYESKILFTEKLKLYEEKNTKQRERREGYRNIVKKILSLIDHIRTDSCYVDFQSECRRPLIALITLLYSEYDDFLPDQSYNPRIGEALLQHPSGALLYEKSCLKETVIPELFNKVIARNHIISSHYRDRDIKNLQLLLNDGIVASIENPITLSGEAGRTYYTLASLINWMPLNRRELENKNCLFINGKPFSAITCDREYERYSRSHSAEAAAIDSIIDSFAV